MYVVISTLCNLTINLFRKGSFLKAVKSKSINSGT